MNNNHLIKPLILIAVVLVLPLAAVAFWGESFQGVIDRWSESPPSATLLAAAIVGILASDVFLPVPSGPITTFAGAKLGLFLGTMSAMAGMTIGATVAFGLARRWGRPLAERFSGPEQLAELEEACQRHGPWMLILTRPLPVLAEACALLVGALQMSWQAFLPIVVISNLLIAATYAALGGQAENYGWLPTALCASIALPLAAAWWWRRRLRKQNSQP